MTNVDTESENEPRRGEFGYRNAEMRKADEELAADPPELIWEPGPHGVWVGRIVYDLELKTASRPQCECGLYGSVKRKFGAHHAETCGRWRAQ